jgi:hypothetical protein
MTQEGQYVYAIIETDQEIGFGPMGIGEGSNEVYTVRHGDVGAVISSSPLAEYPVTRANTMAHQKVMEEVMKQYPMLPVRFGTVAEGTDLIKEKVLKGRHEELRETLNYMRDKVELGLKAMWKDMNPVFQEIVDANADIVRLRDRLMKRRGGVQRDQVRLGEMVKKDLETRKGREEQAILEPLDRLWVERKQNSPFGDRMITNAAFLVEKDKEKAFDLAVEKMTAQYDGRMVFKYVGPIPPCNFVEIVVKW